MYFFRYQQEFGFTIPSRPIVIDDIRVRGVAKACSHQVYSLNEDQSPPTPITVRMLNSRIVHVY